MNRLTVGDLFTRKSETLKLELLTPSTELDRPITVLEVSSPGLVLAGYTERFLANRLHVLGETEVRYLRSLTAEARTASVQTFLSYDLPCVFVTKQLEVPAELTRIALERGVPLFRSALSTSEFYRKLTPYLAEAFAPTTSLHGSLADVYGVGLLFQGRSGIGKSECVLDLVERGHRVVADDLVHVTRRGADVLIGKGNELTHQHMEIRGVGIVDIQAMFGVRAVRQQKRIEVVVQLVDWDTEAPPDRTGLELQHTEILGVAVPQAVIALNPGKNITVVSEVVAMNHLLRFSGVDSAQMLNHRLIAQMAEQRQIREYLSEDYE